MEHSPDVVHQGRSSRHRTIKILVSVAVGGLFLWLAFRNIQLEELWQQILSVNTSWIIPYIGALAVSHYLRAERWLLLLEDLEKKPPRSTLFAGVMVGYMLNNVIPRLGEVSRPVYVARRLKTGSGSLFGTIVLERIIDMSCLILCLLFISFYYVAEPNTISRIFGTDQWESQVYLVLPALIIAGVAAIWAAFKMIRRIDKTGAIENPLWSRFVEFTGRFWTGIKSIRKVRNWPLFVLLTLGIWTGYALMAYLPFWMLDLHLDYQLGLIEAIVVTVISAAGMAVPSPAGVGSYHLFVQQSLWILYSVPILSALTYATITHAMMVLMVFVTGGAALWFDKYYTLKMKLNR